MKICEDIVKIVVVDVVVVVVVVVDRCCCCFMMLWFYMFRETFVSGEYEYKSDENHQLIVVRWNDNSVVTLASNCQGVNPIGAAQRWSLAEKKRVDIVQPNIVRQYNLFMGGVDRMQITLQPTAYRFDLESGGHCLRTYLTWPCKTRGCYIGLSAAPVQLDQLDFRRSVCNVYFKRFCADRTSIGRPSGRPRPLSRRVPLEVRFDNTGHFVQSSGTQRRCAVCGLKVRRQCTKCDVDCTSTVSSHFTLKYSDCSPVYKDFLKHYNY